MQVGRFLYESVLAELLVLSCYSCCYCLFLSMQPGYCWFHYLLCGTMLCGVGVQSAAVNVICELARKNPKNYLSLAPLFFKLMTSSTNNWVLIKIIKLVLSIAACVLLTCDSTSMSQHHTCLLYTSDAADE